MPTCSSSVARVRRWLREVTMTTRALDENAMLNVVGPVVRQQAHEQTATRPEALAVLLARQRAAFLRDGPPWLAERRASLKKLRAALLARKADLEAALDADFGHRSRHETAIMEMLALTWGIDYLHRNLWRFMRPERRRVAWRAARRVPHAAWRCPLVSADARHVRRRRGSLLRRALVSSWHPHAATAAPARQNSSRSALRRSLSVVGSPCPAPS